MKIISLLTVLFLTGFAKADLQVSLTGRTPAFETESSINYYNFGRVIVNSMSTTQYTITNTGATFLQFATTNMWGAGFDFNHNCNFGMYPGQRCNFQIRFWPFNVGQYSGQFEIRFFGPTPYPESIRVDLWGEAVYR